MTLGIFQVGQHFFQPEPECDRPNRLFARSFGDAFLIGFDGPCGNDLTYCATIAVALLRHVSSTGRGFAKAAIARGYMANITEWVRSLKLRESATLPGGLVSLKNGGNMSIPNSMGSAQVQTVRLYEKSPSGPLLTIAAEHEHLLPKKFKHQRCYGDPLLAVDWVHYESQLLSKIQSLAKLAGPTSSKLEAYLRAYSAHHDNTKLPAKWIANAHRFLNVPLVQTDAVEARQPLFRVAASYKQRFRI